MPTPADVLTASLEAHNATFGTLLSLIPAKYYLVQELSEEQVCMRTFIRCYVLTSAVLVDCFKVPEKQQEAKSTQAGDQRGVEESEAGKGQ